MLPGLSKCLQRIKAHPEGLQALHRTLKAKVYPPPPNFTVRHSSQFTMTAPCVEGMIPLIQKVQALHKDRYVSIQWNDGTQSLYPYVWLRDNCQCPLCFLQSAKARKILMTDLDVTTGVERVLLTDPTKVSIVWPDFHTSVFEAEWLRKRCFSQPSRENVQENLFLNERYYWGSDLRIPTVSFKEVLTNDKAAFFWLTTLRSTGIVLLKGADIQQGEVAKLSKRIGYLRLTFYGHTWQVQDKTDANNVAYTSEKLNLHTDYPALHHPPGVQFLHCLKQAVEGGESEIVDGFHVANLLRKTNPEAFSILSSVKVDFTDTGSDYCDFAVQSKNQIIDVDGEGHVVRINYNNATRDSVLNLPVNQVQPFYDALKAFVNLLHSPDNVVSFRMESGDIVTFDNWRLLHGRRNYLSDPDSPRHLEGAYLDWDEVMSRLRILRAAVQGEN
ncbi:gamma-butyrobetaine dioxygenase [Erpetoichthys calabaricus]|uniref:gamma-butyrobetaine dioxygenase n=1 Tax=Erpetoichthys calabaricus TaxID=27687 RepID=A0A8C4XHJ7_ERPCA|nr:gamma-butyrobetaine dioxygenase [Erpetoichthys calabaricus]